MCVEWSGVTIMVEGWVKMLEDVCLLLCVCKRWRNLLLPLLSLR